VSYVIKYDKQKNKHLFGLCTMEIFIRTLQSMLKWILMEDNMQFISTPFSWIVTLMNERVSGFEYFLSSFQIIHDCKGKVLEMKTTSD